ncbi:hypothetical protein A2483_04845 [Candidatus Peregrinibacteria bacterium RIFOXYC2_FULL_33_13]|nr:MAG: hypothetical protein A2483_04845 [Candidatus Peregrinibacteria bacterium RIFOXYC2_FULL_33_13]
MYYSRKGHKNSGVFVVITHDNITGRQEISNVIGIDAVDNQWDKDITHAWAAKMIAEDLHYVLQPCEEQPFSDVPINDYYCPAIQKLKNLGVLQGYQDGTFKPYEAYTRVEIAKILFAAYEIQAPEQYAHYFNDVKPETWFFTYVESLQNEIYKKTPWNIGYQDGSYRPADKVYFNWFTQLLNDLE